MVNNVSFKGQVIVADVNRNRLCLDNNKIRKVEFKGAGTLITFDIDKETMHYKSELEPGKIWVPADINKVLAAYNATKETDLVVDLSLCRIC